MAPFSIGLLGMEDIGRRQRDENSPRINDNAVPVMPTHNLSETTSTQAHQNMPRPRAHRVTSHYNVFQTSCTPASDTPPSYAVASRVRPQAARSLTEGCEPLPSYSCTVQAEAKLLLNLESINPLSPIGEGEWREVYAVLRGTLLSFHKVKDGGAGKLLKSYTLQHAEVGLAPDAQHIVLVPQSRLAHLVPHGARRKAWQKDPHLFKPVKQTIMRLRAETDQITLADSEEERINAFIYAVAAAIDISHAIDERNIPRQCTVPRRRRRQRAQLTGTDLSDPALIAEQERILSQVAPRLGHASVHHATRPGVIPEVNAEPLIMSSREEEELDLSTMREEAAFAHDSTSHLPSTTGNARPRNTRQTTSTTIDSTFSDDMMYASPATNFTEGGKWMPPHHRSAAQIQRYVKRCMPVLLADSQRASDIIIADGKRLKINWRMEMLEEWELSPPSYKSHSFDTENGLTRSISHRSASDSSTHAVQLSSSSVLASEDDQITTLDTNLDNLQLAKVISASTPEKRVITADVTIRQATRHVSGEVHGVVFCF